MFITREEIEYKAAPYGFIATIPKGTKCIPASNQPAEDGVQFFVEHPEDMIYSGSVLDWSAYGFLLREDEVKSNELDD